MRSRVEASRLELVPRAGEQGPHLGREHQIGPRQLTIDVVHPEPDTFHVKRADRAHQRVALLDERTERRGVRLRFQLGDDLFDKGLRGLTMIRGHCACSVLRHGVRVNERRV